MLDTTNEYLSYALILVGALLEANTLWTISDILMSCMTLINMPIIIYLSKYAFQALDDYTKQKKAGKNPVFTAEDIGLPVETDCWK